MNECFHGDSGQSSCSFSEFAFLEHSTKIFTDRNFLMSLSGIAIPVTPFCIANGDSLVRGISVDSDRSRVGSGPEQSTVSAGS